MKGLVLLISAVMAVMLFSTASANGDKVVCYFASWAVYRQGNGKFDVENINPSLCTHLIYAYTGIGEDGSVTVLDSYNDLNDTYSPGKGAFKRFVELKKVNSKVKTMVAIGGWNEGGARFSSVAANDGLRKKFVQNAVAFLEKYKFDGLDLDWEYPTNTERGGHPEDLENFSKLIKELRAAFDEKGFLLTAAVAAAEAAVVQYYQVKQLSKYLDFINVMAYDLHGSWEHNTGINAPLYKSKIDDNPGLNVVACIEGWIKHGADPKKLVLGIPAYGRSFTLADSGQHEVGAPTYGGGNSGPYTNQMGLLGYNEIVEKLRDGQLTATWEEEQKVPYAYSGNQWVGYDNETSIALKVKYLQQKGLGGAMIWSLDTDDFHGASGTVFELLRAINKGFGKKV